MIEDAEEKGLITPGKVNTIFRWAKSSILNICTPIVAYVLLILKNGFSWMYGD